MPLTPSTRGESFSRITSIAGLALIAVGTVVLVGWALDLEVLKGLSGRITMKANAALGLLASGLALRVLRRPDPASRAAGRICATVAGLLGALTLSEHIIGWNLGIDELLFREPPGAAATASPGRMGPNGSLSLALSGLALWCLYRTSARATVVAQILAACVAVLALVPTVGYLYGATELYAVARYTGIAMHTSVSLLLLSAGILAAHPNAGPVAAVMSDTAHAVMARRLLVPAIVVPLVLGYLRIAGERRGLYDTGLGASMLVVAVIVLLSFTIWRTAVALGRSDHARQSAEEALSETEQRFRSLADQAPVLIWVEESGARLWFNKRWFEFTGREPGLMDWRSVVHPDDLPEYQAMWQSAVHSNASYSHQYRVRRADGTFAWVLETASPRVSTRESSGYVGSCVDVSDLRQAQQDREELLTLERTARERAERADRAKDEFIASLSHELRTPLNAILGWMHMLQRETVTESSRSKAAEVVTRNAGVLGRLIEDLLDTSRIATGHLELSRAPTDVKAVVQAAVDSVLPSAEAKGVTLSLAAGPDVPAISGDAQRLQQVVWNLLSNAIKFSSSGGRVDVNVSATADTVIVSIRDQGNGIEPAFLPHVFDRLRQADSSPSRAQGGLGLGLYIAQRLTALHGGHIDAHSDGAGQGATFTVHLPRSADAREPDTGRRTSRDAAPIGAG